MKTIKLPLLIVIFLLLAGGSAVAQEKKSETVSIEAVSRTIRWVMDRICDQTSYGLVIRDSDIDLEKKISVNFSGLPLARALELVFKDEDVSWEISSNQIRIFRPKKRVEVEKKVSGVVKDESGLPVIGAVVMTPDALKATTSDTQGQWSLTLSPKQKVLIISCIGYDNYNLNIGPSSTYEVTLTEQLSFLDESVVIGYGVQKKSVVTAAISGVKGDKLSIVTPTRVDNVLKGMVSGISITQSSGQPGASSRVRVRGIGTINDSNPLYIVDGMPVTGGIDYINPADIESVEVLKDAASAAIYGARGANGVILVTTRSGAEGDAVISYNSSFGIQNPWRKLGVLDASQYATIVNEMNLNIGKPALYDDPASYGKGTDWQEEIFNRNAPVVDHQISVSGGNSRNNYFMSASYFYQEGTIGGNYNHSNYSRVTVRANDNNTIFDKSAERNFLTKLKLGANITYSHDKSYSINANGERGTVLGSAISISPMLPVYAEDPESLLAEHPTALKDSQGRPFSIAGEKYAMMPNPLALLHMPVDDYSTDMFVGGGYLELDILKGLKFKSSLGTDLHLTQDDGFEIPYYMNSNKQSATSSVWSTITKTWSWQVENTLSYDFSLFDSHNFTALLGQSAYSHGGGYVSGTSYKIRNVSQPYIDATDQDLNMRSSSGAPFALSRLASYFARLSYNYKERYMLELTFRRDGSSNFSPENKWASFPSVSAGWNLRKESFMDSRMPFLSNAKLRASWGKNGNQSIGSFAYVSMMQGIAGYMLGLESADALAPGIIPQSYSNANLKWEESVQSDIGLDLGFFKGKLNLTLDAYRKMTEGMLMTMALPTYIGNNRPYGNVGTMKNDGFEFDVSYKDTFSDLNFNVSFNGSYNRNVLVNLDNETGAMNCDSILGTLGTVSRAENGKPFPFFWGWKTDGVFQSDAEAAAYMNDEGKRLQPYASAGDVKFVDVNGDGVIDDDDRTMIGKGLPDWTFGMNVSLEWKGFDLSALLYSTVGNDIYDATRRADYPYVNMQTYLLDRWTGPGTSNRIPKLTAEGDGGRNLNWRSSDLMVYDGSFLRLRSLVLGYTLPKKITSLALLDRVRVYLSAENLFTLTGYHGFDPEISSGSISLGIDRGVYPQARTFSAGVNITF